MLANLPRRMLSAVLALASTTAFAACTDRPLAEDPAAFVGELRTLNPSVTGRIDGRAIFTIEDGVFTAKVMASGLDPVVHRQYLHAEKRCPSDAADENGDGLVDVIEGRTFYGLALLPLDSRLTELAAGVEGGDFPFGPTIRYAQVADVDDLVGALRAFESPDTARFVGLAADKKLELATRTVVVYGVAADLPETVQSIGDLPANLMLPVACAVLQRIE